VDAGCGEGYYPLYIQKALEQNSNSLTVQFSGFDISKWAIQSASKRTKKISWVVASNRKLPYEKASIDLILSLFGFPAWESFKTAQPIKGKVLLADAGENHLLELREIIYPIVNRSSVPPIAEAEKYGYSLELEERLQFSIQLKNKSDIQNLLAMTPHAYRANPEGLTKLDQLSELSVSVDIVLRHLKL
jgi:23S rRNA (guanine745-N1)-methyltransferase